MSTRLEILYEVSNARNGYISVDLIAQHYDTSIQDVASKEARRMFLDNKLPITRFFRKVSPPVIGEAPALYRDIRFDVSTDDQNEIAHYLYESISLWKSTGRKLGTDKKAPVQIQVPVEINGNQTIKPLHLPAEVYKNRSSNWKYIDMLKQGMKVWYQRLFKRWQG